MATSDVRLEVEIRLFHACAMKICNITLIYEWIAKILASWRRSGLRNRMAMSDFRPEVEIRPFRAPAVKNNQHISYLWANWWNFHIIKEIGVEEHDVDVRFNSRSLNMAISCMCNASGHNYRHSSVIVDLAMGQIPHSTKRIFLI